MFSTCPLTFSNILVSRYILFVLFGHLICYGLYYYYIVVFLIKMVFFATILEMSCHVLISLSF